MKCEKCGTKADGLIGGFEKQAGHIWCVPCCDAAGLNVPTALRQPYAGDRTNIIRENWLKTQAERKRQKLDEFLATRKAA